MANIYAILLKLHKSKEEAEPKSKVRLYSSKSTTLYF